MITIRPVEDCDKELVFSWRNNPSVYQFFTNPKPVLPEDHERWFCNILRDLDRAYFLARCDMAPCGLINYHKTSTPEEVEVGVYLAPEFHGRGLSRELLKLGEGAIMALWPNTKQILAVVHVDNVPSSRMFLSNGYNEVELLHDGCFKKLLKRI